MRPSRDNNANRSGRSASVLVVDDHAPARESVIDVLRLAGYEVRGSASAVEALPLLEREAFDVVITDLQMPGIDGLEFIRRMSQLGLRSQVVMITAHATIASAVEAMRFGAFDYLEKPFDAGRLEQLVARAVERRRLAEPEELPRGRTTCAAPSEGGDEDDLGMVGSSDAMRRLRERIRQVAPTDETVLICGESGVGKELVARALHALSRRSHGPLVSLNCPALSPQLAESELFGHRRGSFTGADVDRVGRFELARGGVILLDEITEIDLALQSKLLRVLQERTFEPVGSSETRQADVRVIASTNRDLAAEIAGGRFREDLYYRLAVVPLELPPLRQRERDVELLAEHFLDRAARRLARPRLELADDARELLLAYHWPGNVRELENLITRACVLNQTQVIAAADMRPWLQQPEQAAPAAEALAGARIGDVERATIVATLEKFSGNRARAAEALGIGVRTLSGKLRAYGYAPRTKDFATTPIDADRQKLPVPSADFAESAEGESGRSGAPEVTWRRSDKQGKSRRVRRVRSTNGCVGAARIARRHTACFSEVTRSRVMLEGMFQSSTLPLLEQVVSFTQARHGVLAGNMANLDTPGYHARDLSPEEFEERLKEALKAQEKHAPSRAPYPQYGASETTTRGERERPMSKVSDSMQAILRHDDNNTSLEEQVSEIAKNQAHHNLALSLMNAQLRLLRAAITERA